MRRTWENTLRLSEDARLIERFVVERGRLTMYAVALVARDGGRWTTVRLFDNAHGAHEMHRYTRHGGKRPAEQFHHGTPSEARRAARLEVMEGWQEMVRGWRRAKR
jgi:uncharacterized protein YndB with AHSA1/START domain